MPGSVVRTLLVNINANTGNLSNQLRDATSSFNAIAVAAGIAATAIVGAAAKIGIAGTQMALTYESFAQLTRRNLQDNAKEVLIWVNEVSNSLGMARVEGAKYAAIFSNLIGNAYSDVAYNAKLTKDYIQAVAVVSSATGRTFEDTANRIRSGILGETEAIEDLGINVKISAIESTKAFSDLANGAHWNQLNYQIQQQVLLTAILEQATAKYGTQVAQTTQFGIMQFTSAMRDAALNVGQGFIPILQQVLPYLISFANTLVRITSVVSQFVRAFFGVKKEDQFFSDSFQDLSSGVGAVGSAADAQDDLADATKKAAEAAKGGVLAFDKLNIAQDPKKASGAGSGGAGSGGAGSGGTGAGGGIAGYNSAVADFGTPITDEVYNKVEEFRKLLAKINEILEPAKIGAANLGSELKKFGSFAFDNLKNFAKDFLAPIGSYILGEGFPRLANILANQFNRIDYTKLTKGFDDVFKSASDLAILTIGEGLNLLDTVLKNLGTWATNTVLPGVLDSLKKTFDAMKPLVKPLAEALESLVTALTKIAVPVFENLKRLYDDFILPTSKIVALEAIDKIKELSEKVDVNKISNLANNLAEIAKSLAGEALKLMGIFVKDFLLPVGEWTFGEGIPSLVAKIKEFVTGIDWNPLNNSLSEFFKTLSDLAIIAGKGFIDFCDKTLFPLFKLLLEKGIPTAIDGLKNLVKELQKISGLSSESFGKIVTGIASIVSTSYDIATKALKDLYNQGLKPIIEAATKKTIPKAIEATDKNMKVLSPAISKAWSNLTIEVGKLGESILYLVDKALPGLELILGGIVIFLASVATGIITILRVGIDFFSGKLFEDLGKSWDKFWGGAGDTIGTWYQSKYVPFWDDVTKDFGKGVDDSGKNWNKFWDGAGTKINNWFSKDFTPFWNNVGKDFKKGTDESLKNWTDFWTRVSDEIKAWEEETWSPWVDGVKESWTEFWDGVGVFVTEGLRTVEDNSTKWFNESFTPWVGDIKEGWNKFWSGAGTFVTDGLKTVKDNTTTWYNEKFTPWIGDLSAGWSGFWSGAVNSVEGGLKTVKENTSTWYSEKFTPWVSDLSTSWNGFWGGAGAFATDGLKTVKENATTWYDNDFKPWVDGVKDTLSSVFTGLGDIISRALNTASEGLKASINWVINKINSFSITLPDIMGGGTIGFPHITPLADGGVITRPTIGLIGEAGPEVAMPLKNTDFIKSFAKDIAGYVGGNNNNGGGDIVIKLDSMVLARVMRKASTTENNRVGKSLIQYK